jgi:hypothetical protein
MTRCRNGIILATVVFTLLTFILSAQADPLVLGKPSKPGLPQCLEEVAQLQQIIADQQTTIAEQEATIVALQEQIEALKASCIYTCNGTLSAEGRWCDNLDGTIKDMTTGLVWLQNAFCMSATWYEALKNVPENLRDGVCGLTDGSSWGDWRLPTANELHGITSQGVETVLYSTPRFFVGIDSCLYWTSTTHSIGAAYGVSLVIPNFWQAYPKDTQILPMIPVRNCK